MFQILELKKGEGKDCVSSNIEVMTVCAYIKLMVVKWKPRVNARLCNTISMKNFLTLIANF